jgi:GNAT superfamily N-acetyltransferase
VKVAILQNQVGIDGRSRVIGEIAVALNEIGVTPDVYTLSPPSQRRRWLDVLMEARDVRCKFPQQPRLPLRRGYAYRTIAHNWLLRNALGDYDLIVNSNDFVGFLPRDVRRMHYFHFPLRTSFGVMPRYQKRGPRLVAIVARWAADRFDGAILPRDILLANSRFTRQRVSQLWPDASVDLLYPPVDLPATYAEGHRDIDVVTLGNIAPDNQQQEQDEIAAAIPKRRFGIIGGVRSRSYARRVERAVREKGLTNVTLAFDAPGRRVSNFLARSQVFLQLKASDHFGIAVAQAIGHGCIPIVPDSGAQVELVTESALRFRAHGDVLWLLRDALAGRIPEPGYIRELRARVRDLVPARFRAQIKDALR